MRPKLDAITIPGAGQTGALPSSRAVSKKPLSLQENPSDTRLMKACQDFEAVFLSILWREMLKSTKTDLGGWDGVAQQAVATKWAEAGGIGLAKVIYRSMANHPLE